VDKNGVHLTQNTGKTISPLKTQPEKGQEKRITTNSLFRPFLEDSETPASRSNKKSLPAAIDRKETYIREYTFKNMLTVV
jgi:hypothetical protein